MAFFKYKIDKLQDFKQITQTDYELKSIKLVVVFFHRSCSALFVKSLSNQNIDRTMLDARAPNPRMVEVAPSNWKLRYSELPYYVAAAVLRAAQ